MEYLEEIEIKDYQLLSAGELDDYNEDIIETSIEVGFEFMPDQYGFTLMLDILTVSFLVKYPKGDKRKIISFKPKRSNVKVPDSFPINDTIKWDKYFNISIDVENKKVYIENK